MIASRLPYSGQASLELKLVDTSKSESLQETLLSPLSFGFSTTFVPRLQVTCISILNTITNSQNNTQFTHSFTTQKAGLFGLCIAEQYVTCTNSSPVVHSTASSPLHPARHTYHPSGIFSSAGNCTSCHIPALIKKNLRFITGCCSFILCPQSHPHKTVGTFMQYAGIVNFH
jgi:hypothetical protein